MLLVTCACYRGRKGDDPGAQPARMSSCALRCPRHGAANSMSCASWRLSSHPATNGTRGEKLCSRVQRAQKCKHAGVRNGQEGGRMAQRLPGESLRTITGQSLRPVRTGGRTPLFPKHVDAPNAGANKIRTNPGFLTSSEHRHGYFSPSTTPPLWLLQSG